MIRTKPFVINGNYAQVKKTVKIVLPWSLKAGYILIRSDKEGKGNSGKVWQRQRTGKVQPVISPNVGP